MSQAIAAPRKSRKTQYNPASEIVRACHMPIVIGMSYPTVWRWYRSGRFPQPIRLGPTSIGWRRSDIEAWLRERQRA